MHLAFCLYRFTPFGGLERSFLAIAEACARRGQRVTAFARRWTGERPHGIQVEELPVRALTNAGLDRAFARALEPRIAAGSFDAVVGFNRLPGLDVFYAADPCLAATRRQPRFTEFGRGHGTRAAWERALAGPASPTEILVQSERERERYREHYGTRAERLHVLPPGLRPEFLAASAARIALVIEGGAMRGVVSAGMVGALEELGLTDAFDGIYGSSAGAINGAYFLAGQARLGTTIYAEDINNRHFIDLLRPLTGRPIVNLGFLLDDVAVSRKPLDTGRVLAARSPLTVMATDIGTTRAVALRGFTSGPELITALRAGATMPVIAGPPVTYGGRLYLDASLTRADSGTDRRGGREHAHPGLADAPDGRPAALERARSLVRDAAIAAAVAGARRAVPRVAAGRTRRC